MIPKPRPKASGRATSRDGVEIAWYRFGGGPRQVLFIPTWNIVDARVVGHQVAALERNATVVTYDPRGHGASDRPAHGYDFSNHAEDAFAVMEVTGLRRPAIVTASRGLNAAVLLAADHPDHVERLVSIASYMELKPRAAPIDPKRLESWRIDWAGFVVPFVRSVFPEAGSEDVTEEVIGIAMEASPEIITTQEMELDWSIPAARLSSVGCPTLILHGSADVVPVALVERIAATIPNARLQILPNAGHRPDIRSPEIVHPILMEFLLGEGDGRHAE